MITTTTIEPFSSSEMATQNESNNNVSGEKSDFNLHNIVDDLPSPTTIESIIENRITDEYQQESNNNNSIHANDSNQQPQIESESMNQNDLLEQLKRTRELLSIQIEKLKSLEQIMFWRRRETVMTTDTNVNHTNITDSSTIEPSSLITTELPYVDVTTTESSNDWDNHDEHDQDNQIDQPSNEMSTTTTNVPDIDKNITTTTTVSPDDDDDETTTP
ncbi:hypothetical protein BLA29_007917, partial [Euroglyphus maynei]